MHIYKLHTRYMPWNNYKGTHAPENVNLKHKEDNKRTKWNFNPTIAELHGRNVNIDINKQAKVELLQTILTACSKTDS